MVAGSYVLTAEINGENKLFPLSAIIKDTNTEYIRENTWLYMDYGSEELDNHIGYKMLQAFGRVYEAFLKKGVMGCARIVPGGTHSEASWQRQVPVFMECLEMNGWDEK